MSKIGQSQSPTHRWARYAFLLASVMAATLPPASQSQAPVPHLYSVPPGGVSQFPVRNGPATEGYLSIEKYMGIGQAVPSGFWQYQLKDEKGLPFSLAHLRGKVIVMDFWGTTCGPCLRAMPHLGSLAGSYHTQNVVFLSVCESPGDVKGFRKRAAQFHSPGLRFLIDPVLDGGQRSLKGSLRGLLHNGMGQPAQLIVNQAGSLAGALQGYDDAKDPDMRVLRQSVDTVLKNRAAHSTKPLRG